MFRSIPQREAFRSALEEEWGTIFTELMRLVRSHDKASIHLAAKMLHEVFEPSPLKEGRPGKLNLKVLTDEQIRILEAALPEHVADARGDDGGDGEQNSH